VTTGSDGCNCSKAVTLYNSGQCRGLFPASCSEPGYSEVATLNICRPTLSICSASPTKDVSPPHKQQLGNLSSPCPLSLRTLSSILSSIRAWLSSRPPSGEIRCVPSTPLCFDRHEAARHNFQMRMLNPVSTGLPTRPVSRSTDRLVLPSTWQPRIRGQVGWAQERSRNGSSRSVMRAY